METARIWINDFVLVLTRPQPDSFRQVGEHAYGKVNTGLLLAAAQVALAYGLNYLLGGSSPPLAALIFQIILAPVLLLVVPFWLNLIYRKVFKGEQERHSEIFYLVALLLVFLGTLGIFLGQVPLLGPYLLAAVIFYFLLLLVLGLASITGMRTWQCIVAVLIGLPLSLLSIMFVAMLMPSLMQATRQIF